MEHNNFTTTYYVVTPNDDLRGTVWEEDCIGFTHNKFLFDYFMRNTLSNTVNEDRLDVHVYEVPNDCHNHDMLFQRVKADTGYELHENLEIELFESIANPDIAVCLTNNWLDSYDACEDVNEFMMSLYTCGDVLLRLCDIISYAPPLKSMLELLFNKYAVLSVIFDYAGSVEGIQNTPLRESVKQLISGENKNHPNGIELYGSIYDIYDTVLKIIINLRS